MKQLRKTFNEDCRRHELALSSFRRFPALETVQYDEARRQEEQRQLNAPNLHIPTADGSIYLPQ